MGEFLMFKKIKCNDGLNINTFQFHEIRDEIYKKKLLKGGYKFKYNNIKCKLLYIKVPNFGINMYSYINITVDDHIIKKMNLPFNINYNDKLWIGLCIENFNDLSLNDLVFKDEKYLNNENYFKLPSYGVMICMSIINSYLHTTKYV
jgi:hypothetical protein